MQPMSASYPFDLEGLAARLITVDKTRVWREAIVASPVSRFRRQLGEDQKGMDFCGDWSVTVAVPR